MPNKLAQETSPYLLQHVDNPVDWYPWSEEALQIARDENKPILLSIGYAACHWCHVMAHESFEDSVTAEFMNRHFVNIKVDREERPDLDAIYMQAVVAMTGQGGWPMTVFLTPEGRPFYGGTYFPPAPRYGMPSFIQLMQGIVNAWENKRDDVVQSAGDITKHLQRTAVLTGQEDVLSPGMFAKATSALATSFDHHRGGFGGAPKFPPSMTLEYLLQSYVLHGDKNGLHMAETTLKEMAYGGMYDQLGGGFARYSTDVNWLVPHFEKMLYDNALLARAYLHAYQVTGKPLYCRIVEESLDFVIRELRHEEGGFYSSYDADSEGEEGKFYIWSAAEIEQHLGEDAALFKQFYNVTAQGNWEGNNILNIQKELAELASAQNLSEEEAQGKIAAAKQKLYDVRAQRIWPGLDDKVLTAWNGLMLAAFAEAGRILNRPDYTETAVQNATFLYNNMRTQENRLLRTWKAGNRAKYNGYLEDYAYLADGLLALYQTTFDEQWFIWAQQLAETMLSHFHDGEHGGFFDTSDDHEELIHRPKDLQDNAVPSANAMAAHVLLRLSLYTGNSRYWEVAETAVSSLYGAMVQHPNAFAHWLCAAVFITSNPQEVAIVGELDSSETQALIDATFSAFRPNLVTAVGKATNKIPLLVDRKQLDGRATAYVCRRFVCQQPVNNANALAEQLNAS